MKPIRSRHFNVPSAFTAKKWPGQQNGGSSMQPPSLPKYTVPSGPTAGLSATTKQSSGSGQSKRHFSVPSGLTARRKPSDDVM